MEKTNPCQLKKIISFVFQQKSWGKFNCAFQPPFVETLFRLTRDCSVHSIPSNYMGAAQHCSRGAAQHCSRGAAQHCSRGAAQHCSRDAAQHCSWGVQHNIVHAC